MKRIGKKNHYSAKTMLALTKQLELDNSKSLKGHSILLLHEINEVI